MKTLWTIGHSTRSFEDFVRLLRAHGIETVLDIRTVPKSRHNPQYSKAVLGPKLRARRIGYRHLPALGGLRRSRGDSPNTAWRNASFRGYADYMLTPEFKNGIAALKKIASKKRTAIMCAEAVPWRCHRSLVGDWMTRMEGWTVLDILSGKTARAHAVTSFARKRGGKLLYA